MPKVSLKLEREFGGTIGVVAVDEAGRRKTLLSFVPGKGYYVQPSLFRSFEVGFPLDEHGCVKAATHAEWSAYFDKQDEDDDEDDEDDEDWDGE